jgi:nucleotide-binding universal stress UspA family protein
MIISANNFKNAEMKRILIALDFDSSALKIAEAGYNLARAMQADVILLHVTDEASYYSSQKYSPITGFGIFSNEDPVENDVVAEAKNVANNFLKNVGSRFEGVTTELAVENGPFAENILEVASQMNADLIVMGSHGRGGWEKILLGSVAEKVLHQSSIPMLIIPVKNKQN